VVHKQGSYHRHILAPEKDGSLPATRGLYIVKKPKFQALNPKQIQITEIQDSKRDCFAARHASLAALAHNNTSNNGSLYQVP